MNDHAFDLLIAIEGALAGVSLPGGWHSNPRPNGAYPYGTFYITRSLRQAGNVHRHSGIVNIWCRHESGDPVNSAVRDAYRLSDEALTTLDGGSFAVSGFRLHDFRADEPRRELMADGVTWRGYFQFTALTS